MTDRPIIMSAPMVRALLDGRKTMARRLAWQTAVPISEPSSELLEDYELRGWQASERPDGWYLEKPTAWQKVAPGDRLWVREAWKILGREGAHGWECAFIYSASNDTFLFSKPQEFHAARALWDKAGNKQRSPIYMPRWASRLTLLVRSVRVERLQEITEADAKAEGVEARIAGQDESGPVKAFRTGFVYAWRDLHGSDGPDSWTANPWVTVTEFEVVRGNVDAAGGETQHV